MTEQNTWSIEISKPAEEGYADLDGSIRAQVRKQIEKLKKSPELGDPLGNRDGIDLTGYRKIYVAKKSIRIVFEIHSDRNVVRLIAIGKREDAEVSRQTGRERENPA